MVLADPSPVARTGIKRLLAEAPEIHVVEECADEKGLIAAMGDWHPDFVFMDFRLGGGTARDVLQQCTALKPRPVCIVYTAETDANTRAICYSAGADVFYDKRQDIAPLLWMLRKFSAKMLNSQALAG
jgi:DNA-binding NarL/FixJ family response regulator